MSAWGVVAGIALAVLAAILLIRHLNKPPKADPDRTYFREKLRDDKDKL